MTERAATLIIEPRSLVCEALVSLMESHSYRVICGVASAADIDSSLLVADVPRLVVLGALPADEAAAAASRIRGLWPQAKIILLFERVSSADFLQLLASQIDGGIPLSAPPDVLVGILQRILEGDLKIFVHEAASRSVANLPSVRPIAPVAPVDEGREAPRATFDAAFPIRVRHGLSEREAQVLMDLVKGLPNKMIARKRDIAEATVKVHLKSILRKIRMANRTQAAIWAMENGFGADDLQPAPPPIDTSLKLAAAAA